MKSKGAPALEYILLLTVAAVIIVAFISFALNSYSATTNSTQSGLNCYINLNDPACIKCNFNGTCDSALGEDCSNCQADCGVCSPATCPNGTCDPAIGEDCTCEDCIGQTIPSGDECCSSAADCTEDLCMVPACTGDVCINTPITDGEDTSGTLTCSSPDRCCSGACFNTQSDENNCGSCGSVCAGTCNNGVCCGNGVQESGEDCDGSDYAQAQCSSLGRGFIGGTLACNVDCTYDTSACTLPPVPLSVVINDPDPVTYLTPNVPVRITIGRQGTCEYSLNGGARKPLVSVDNIVFTVSETLTNGNYQLAAFCGDYGGIRNDAEYVDFVVSSTGTCTSLPLTGTAVCGNGIVEFPDENCEPSLASPFSGFCDSSCRLPDFNALNTIPGWQTEGTNARNTWESSYDIAHLTYPHDISYVSCTTCSGDPFLHHCCQSVGGLQINSYEDITRTQGTFQDSFLTYHNFVIDHGQELGLPLGQFDTLVGILTANNRMVVVSNYNPDNWDSNVMDKTHVAAYDYNGNLLFDTRIDSLDTDQSITLFSNDQVAQDSEGNVYLTGHCSGCGDMPNLFKIDTTGAIEWSIQCSDMPSEFLSDFPHCSAYPNQLQFVIAQLITYDDALYTLGTDIYSMDGGGALGKFDSSGNLLWYNRLPSIESYGWAGLSTNSGYVGVVYTDSVSPNQCYRLVIFNKSGQKVSEKIVRTVNQPYWDPSFAMHDNLGSAFILENTVYGFV